MIQVMGSGSGNGEEQGKAGREVFPSDILKAPAGRQMRSHLCQNLDGPALPSHPSSIVQSLAKFTS